MENRNFKAAYFYFSFGYFFTEDNLCCANPV